MPRTVALALFAMLTVGTSTTGCSSTPPSGPDPEAEYQLRLIGSLPATVTSGEALQPIEIEAALVSASGDDFDGAITISLSAGSGTLSGTVSKMAVDGRVVFSNLVIAGTGSHVFRVQAVGLDPLDLAPITVTDPPPAPIAAAALLDAIDQGNTGTGADLRVRLRLSADHAVVDEYRLVVYAPAAGPAPTREAILALPAARYLGVKPAQDLQWIPFESGSLDMQGSPITEGVSYRVAVIAVPSEAGRASGVSSTPSSLTLEQASYIETIATINAGTGGLALDAAGNLYMADFGATLDGPPGQVVYRITPERVVSVFAQGFQGASGNAFDDSGNLFQSSIVGGYVSRIAPDGTVEQYVTGLNQPVGVVTTPAGELYIAACGANAIIHVAADKTVSTYFSGGGLLNCPNGIARAPDGTLYVANFGNGAVIEISPGKVGSVLAQLPPNLGHLSLVGDQLYVAARGGNQLFRLDLEGNATVIAGTGARGLRDGNALQATLSLTNDVVVSADGLTLYFNDVIGTGNRVISPTAVRALHLVPGP